jgi:hypothetical protein
MTKFLTKRGEKQCFFLDLNNATRHRMCNSRKLEGGGNAGKILTGPAVIRLFLQEFFETFFILRSSNINAIDIETKQTKASIMGKFLY